MVFNIRLNFMPLSELPTHLTMYEITDQGTQAKTSTTAPPAIGVDGSINFASSYWIFSSISQNGSNRWQFNTEGKFMRSKPAIGPDNTVYVGTRTNVFAINSDGTQKWIYTDNLNLESAPAIGKDGEIYLTVDHLDDQPYSIFTPPKRFLLALNPDGTKKWLFGDGNDSFSAPAIAADGTIYIGSISKFYALNPDGSVKWTFTEGPDITAPRP